MDPIASLFLFFSLCNPVISAATTFGDITLVDQARNTQYFVHGRIVGNGSAAKERKLQVPFTYWKLAVIDQPLGRSLSGEIDIREPGGQVGELGYHVAGAATFRDGEEVYVALRDTDEGDVKEVVGLASGKFTVEGNTLKSGLGPTVLGPGGQPISAEEFAQVIRRAASGRETLQDKTIFVNRGLSHAGDQHSEHSGVLAKPKPRLNFATETPVSHAPKETTAPAAETPAHQENSVKSSSAEPEKLSAGTPGLWWIAALAAVALALAALIFKRR